MRAAHPGTFISTPGMIRPPSSTRFAAAFSAPVWCGGMLESGVGRAHNIHLATLENFTKPGDTSSSSRYWARDIVNEPLETTGGIMPVPPGPGIGVTLDVPFLDSVTRWRADIGAPARIAAGSAP